MRLVLDQGVSRDAAALLRSLGYDCTHVGEIGMSQAADEEILAFSLGRNAVVVNTGRGLSRDPGSLRCIRAFRNSYAAAELGCSRGGRSGSRGSGQFRRRAEGRLPDHGEGAQDNVPPAADRNLRVKRPVPSAFQLVGSTRLYRSQTPLAKWHTTLERSARSHSSSPMMPVHTRHLQMRQVTSVARTPATPAADAMAYT